MGVHQSQDTSPFTKNNRGGALLCPAPLHRDKYILASLPLGGTEEALQKPWNMKDVFKVFVNLGAYHV